MSFFCPHTKSVCIRISPSSIFSFSPFLFISFPFFFGAWWWVGVNVAKYKRDDQRRTYETIITNWKKWPQVTASATVHTQQKQNHTGKGTTSFNPTTFFLHSSIHYKR
ncbi:hypothetical protein, unlikely [Trypanosoma brucei gambiense DAL972]|uniref:Uncharacterized protein n=1 Tax=Trypanosoma brucei gambiense (strain MHOM/CI/86/DAL972) TaxID=679716 RepID=D0A1Q6_TRYB9|nr:hypothetical protein, unlikely [Trypanosoma brucei gambiense DAL972]CBH15199.1 hypothetical protein, unlikely [Trypanosoma brucei gambiense DAL972]|eukprot:XP_011777464.1 hypothetical protein, unlikely [Trypanosoma brucei gambiense DAL972]